MSVDEGAVSAAALAAVAAGREELGGEHAESADRVDVDRLPVFDRFVVAPQDLCAVRVLLGEPARVRMSKLADGRANASWYNPRSGQWRSDDADRAEKRAFGTGIPSGRGAPDYHFDPPGEPADGSDWVLLLEVE